MSRKQLYVTAAITIPVLYVALILQRGASFDSMLTRLKLPPMILTISSTLPDGWTTRLNDGMALS